MTLVQEEDQIPERKRWGAETVTKVKKYIRRRPVLKYSLFGAGFLLCISVALCVYLLEDSSEEETSEDYTVGFLRGK